MKSLIDCEMKSLFSLSGLSLCNSNLFLKYLFLWLIDFDLIWNLELNSELTSGVIRQEDLNFDSHSSLFE